MPRPQSKSEKRVPQQSAQHEIVSPLWLVKAVALTSLAALFCAYLTFCLLFYQGQWQLVLHPTRTTASPASIAGVPYELIRFGPDESATPQLTGWWIPSDPGGHYAHLTVLFLPDGNGSLADSIPTLANLHNLGINVFAFDYRGYGQSAPIRPNQQNMTQDSDSAWQYLTTSRSIPPQRIIPYGNGTGAYLATRLATLQRTIPALVVDMPRTDLLDVAMLARVLVPTPPTLQPPPAGPVAMAATDSMPERVGTAAMARRPRQPQSLRARRPRPRLDAAALAERRESLTLADLEGRGPPAATAGTDPPQPRPRPVAPTVRLRPRPAAVVRAARYLRSVRPATAAAREERERRRRQPIRT